MTYTRRKFLKTGMISAVSAGFLLSATRIGVAQKPTRGKVGTTIYRSDLPIEAQMDPVVLFKPETFKPYVGSIFTAPNALGQEIELVLTAVTVFQQKNGPRYTSKSIETETFSLTFKASEELPPFTSIHGINHPSLGEFGLFLTKHRANNGDLFYEAIINHIR